MKNEIINNIENELSILMSKLGEDKYNEFIKGNILLSIYDQIDNELYNSYIFDKDFLIHVYQIAKYKNEITF